MSFVIMFSWKNLGKLGITLKKSLKNFKEMLKTFTLFSFLKILKKFGEILKQFWKITEKNREI